MDPAYWIRRWDEGRIGFHQKAPNPLLAAHGALLGARRRVLVPLSGKSVDLLWLAAAGHEVVGVEIAEKAVRAFHEEHRLPAEVREEDGFRVYRSGPFTTFAGDFFALRPEVLGKVDAAYDRAALIAFDPAARGRYAAQLLRLAGPAAPVLLVALAYDQREMAGPPFSVTEAEVRALFGSERQVRPLGGQDVLAENLRFKERGLSALREEAWLLGPREA